MFTPNRDWTDPARPGHVAWLLFLSWCVGLAWFGGDSWWDAVTAAFLGLPVVALLLFLPYFIALWLVASMLRFAARRAARLHPGRAARPGSTRYARRG